MHDANNAVRMKEIISCSTKGPQPATHLSVVDVVVLQFVFSLQAGEIYFKIVGLAGKERWKTQLCVEGLRKLFEQASN